MLHSIESINLAISFDVPAIHFDCCLRVKEAARNRYEVTNRNEVTSFFLRSMCMYVTFFHFTAT